MMRSLWIAKTGLDAQQTQLDVISNNLANTATKPAATTFTVIAAQHQSYRAEGRQCVLQCTIEYRLAAGQTCLPFVAAEAPGEPGAKHQGGNPWHQALASSSITSRSAIRPASALPIA